MAERGVFGATGSTTPPGESGRAGLSVGGEEPIELPPPVASLVQQQHSRASGPWLFPGGKPGTHLGPERLCRRLQQLGIQAGIARAGALLALASAVPAPILAELLGYHDDTANHWRRLAAGTWARYASLASTPSA